MYYRILLKKHKYSYLYVYIWNKLVNYATIIQLAKRYTHQHCQFANNVNKADTSAEPYLCFVNSKWSTSYLTRMLTSGLDFLVMKRSISSFDTNKILGPGN